MSPDNSILLERLLALATAASVACTGAVIYLHVRFARVETILSDPKMGVVAVLTGLSEKFHALDARVTKEFHALDNRIAKMEP